VKVALKKWLLGALSAQLIFACGPEATVEVGLTGAVTQTGQEASLERPTGEPVKVQFVVDDKAVGDPAQVTAMAVDVYGLILIDRTGSMMETRASTGNTRCLDAVKMANTSLSKLVDPNGPYKVTKVAVWTFAGRSVVARTSGYVGYTQARDAITALEGTNCADETPLAEAICMAVDSLSAVSPSATSHLVVSTDGMNNAGDSNNPNSCHGPSGDISTPGTWQQKVHAKLLSNPRVSTSPSYWSTGPITLTSLDGQPGAMALCSGDAQCDPKLFAALADTTGGEYRGIKDADAAYPCLTPASCPAPQSTNTGNQFSFSTGNTGSATSNTVNHSIYLLAGETLTLGTCGVTGATGTGDTYLRLFGPSGTQAAANDDACGGRLSSFTFTASTSGIYLVRAGCYSSGSCSGKVVYTIRGSFSYSATNTNSATINTANRSVYLKQGQNIQLGTCGVAGSAGSGDTFLRLFNGANVEVATNDDACGGILSNISYSVPAVPGGTQQLRAGCYGTTSCSGTVVYLITDGSP
jgi:hypothetical protein